MKEKYTQAELNDRCFFRVKFGGGMQNRIVLAPSKAAFLWTLAISDLSSL